MADLLNYIPYNKKSRIKGKLYFIFQIRLQLEKYKTNEKSEPTTMTQM